MSRCECGFEAKSGAGLAAHRRHCDSERPAGVSGAVGRGERATLAAQAVVLARAIDVCESDRELPALSRELRLLMERLDALSDVAGVAVDPVDELTARRKHRRGA